MPKADFWQPKARTAAAIARLCWAKLLIGWVPFKRWRGHLGLALGCDDRRSIEQARGLAADVEWAAKRMRFSIKCLPRAMALSWMLRRERVRHSVVIAVRPSEHRQSPDALHAWVEIGAERILGDLPGPWIETARLGS